MEKRVSAFEARRELGKVLDAVGRGDSVVIERHGQPAAVVISVDLYRHWQELRRRAMTDLEETLRAAGERANLSEDEAMELALEAVAEVRAAKRQRHALTR